jgi:hypothetical protein
MQKKMTVDDIQKANDRKILEKLTMDQVLTEEEDNRLDELICIAANNLGITLS